MNVQFTLSTLPLLALTLYLCHRAKGQLLPVVMFMSIFQAASVINITIAGTQLGLGASYLLLLFAIAKQISTRAKPEHSLHKPRRSTAVLISLFAAYATVSVFVFPRIFAGTLFTNPKFGAQVPLEWQAGYLPQIIYLLVSVSLYFVAAYKTSPAELSNSLRWYVGGGVLAACIALYQYLCLKTGLPFPTEIFHSNPVYAIFEAYEINGFPRMDATFTEAAAAAFVFASAFALSLWDLLSGMITPKKLAISALLLLGLLLTISTTAYICLTFIFLVAGWHYFWVWKGNAQQRSARFLLGVPAVAVVLAILAVPAGQQAVNSLIHTVILDKTKSSSYEERSRWNDDAIQTAADTYWLGAGWGICRASSIVPTVLGNVGLPGILLLSAFAVQPFLSIFKKNGVHGRLHGAALFALATLFLDLIVSGPELSASILWLLLAVVARLSGTNHQPRAGRRIQAPLKAFQTEPLEV